MDLIKKVTSCSWSSIFLIVGEGNTAKGQCTYSTLQAQNLEYLYQKVEVEIYIKRKQESKKTKKNAFDQESDQKK